MRTVFVIGLIIQMDHFIFAYKKKLSDDTFSKYMFPMKMVSSKDDLNLMNAIVFTRELKVRGDIVNSLDTYETLYKGNKYVVRFFEVNGVFKKDEFQEYPYTKLVMDYYLDEKYFVETSHQAINYLNLKRNIVDEIDIKARIWFCNRYYNDNFDTYQSIKTSIGNAKKLGNVSCEDAYKNYVNKKCKGFSVECHKMIKEAFDKCWNNYENKHLF